MSGPEHLGQPKSEVSYLEVVQLLHKGGIYLERLRTMRARRKHQNKDGSLGIRLSLRQISRPLEKVSMCVLHFWAAGQKPGQL